MSSGDATEGAVAPGPPEFSTTTWNTAQTATAAADDDVVDERVRVTHALTTGAAEYAGGMAVRVPAVTVTDDEEQEILVNGSTSPFQCGSPRTLSLPEGEGIEGGLPLRPFDTLRQAQDIVSSGIKLKVPQAPQSCSGSGRRGNQEGVFILDDTDVGFPSSYLRKQVSTSQIPVSTGMTACDLKV